MKSAIQTAMPHLRLSLQLQLVAKAPQGAKPLPHHSLPQDQQTSSTGRSLPAVALRTLLGYPMHQGMIETVPQNIPPARTSPHHLSGLLLSRLSPDHLHRCSSDSSTVLRRGYSPIGCHQFTISSRFTASFASYSPPLNRHSDERSIIFPSPSSASISATPSPFGCPQGADAQHSGQTELASAKRTPWLDELTPTG